MFNIERQLKLFNFNNKHFILKEPVVYSLKYQNNLWVYECPKYGLHSFSEDRYEAFCQFGEEFDFLYEGLIHDSDENLTQDAIELRDMIKSDVLKVEKI